MGELANFRDVQDDEGKDDLIEKCVQMKELKMAKSDATVRR